MSTEQTDRIRTATAARADFRWDVYWLLGDLNRRDRRGLLAELDRMLAELPPDTTPRAALGTPKEIAATLRRGANLPEHVSLRLRLRRSSPLTKLALTGALSAVLGTTWYLVTTTTYSLEQGSYWSFIGDQHLEAGGVREARYEYYPGRIFRIGFAVHNPGKLPVTLLGFPNREQPALTSIEGVCVSPWNEYTDEACTPLVPTEIAPGEERMVWLDIRMTPCEAVKWARSPRGFRTRPEIPLEFRVWGVDRTQLLELRDRVITIYTTEASVLACVGPDGLAEATQ